MSAERIPQAGGFQNLSLEQIEAAKEQNRQSVLELKAKGLMKHAEFYEKQNLLLEEEENRRKSVPHHIRHKYIN